jgi:hypothetical protein
VSTVNPIDQPDYNPATYREPNPETIGRIRDLAARYHGSINQARELRHHLDHEIRAAKAAGHSFPQLREASGLSIATIQAIIEKGR